MILSAMKCSQWL